MAEKRKKVWIDRTQTLLSIRLALYFIVYQASVWLLFAIERSINETLARMFGPGWGVYVFALTAAVPAAVLGILFIWDAVRMMHRVVGPVVRFRRAIRAVAAGEALSLISLREGDYFGELRDDFNAMLRALEQRGAVVLTPQPNAGRAEKPAVTV